jgi:asparagine synthase (glutamine-hydrolysing)
MCGIAGIAGRRDEDLALRMSACLAHRGPDADGLYGAEGVTLAHRRLSIIDLASGQQPMQTEDGALCIVYNGEIYNFRELRRELEAEGYRFRTDCDTEVILHAYRQWGEACVERFQGMFAFALWDVAQQTLFLARDQIGVKPLYYAEHEGCLYFASEIRSLLEVPGITREIDWEGVDDYLTYLYTVPPRTCFKQIRQLPPGHCARWRTSTSGHANTSNPTPTPESSPLLGPPSKGVPAYPPGGDVTPSGHETPSDSTAMPEAEGRTSPTREDAGTPFKGGPKRGTSPALEIWRYWYLEATPLAHSEAEWSEAIRAALQDTVTRYMISDVPLGAFLSGGLDSATIVNYMRGAASGPVNTFTIGFTKEGNLYDETEAARAAAKHFGTEHRTLTMEDDVAALLPTMVRHFGDPFGNPTALLTYAISELVRKHVTVVLSGDGGDENFGGYPRYSGMALLEHFYRVPRPLRSGLINPLIQRLPESTRGLHALRRIREFSAGSLLPPVEAYAAWISYYAAAQKQALYTPDIQRALAGRDALDYIRGLAAECQNPDPVAQAMYVDIHSFLPNNVLQYGDRMSMAHGLETRVPLADTRLIELVAQIPPRMKATPRHSKRILRRAMQGVLPDEILRRKKIGFNPPMGVWLNTRLKPLVDDYLSEETLRRRGYFHPAAVQQLIQEHRSSRRDHTWHLWALVVFEEWHRQFVD